MPVSIPISTTNPWGTSALEAQRSDMWVVDFSQVARGIGVALQGTYDLSPLARQVIMPEESVNSENFMTYDRITKFPTNLNAIGPVRCNFLLGYGSVVNIVNFLKTWKERSLIGQNNLVPDESIPALDPTNWANNAFKFDVTIQFIRGNSVLASSNPITTVTVTGQAWTLTGCWLASLQGPGANHATGNELCELQVDLMPDAIVPLQLTN